MMLVQNEMRAARQWRLKRPDEEQSDESEHQMFKDKFLKGEKDGDEAQMTYCMRVLQAYEWMLEML